MDTTEKVEKVAILVDVLNIFHASRVHQPNSKIDYGKLVGELVGNRSLVKAIAYVIQKPEFDNSSFLSALRGKGFEVKSMNSRSDDSERHNRSSWNVDLAMDAVLLANEVDTIILVSGDRGLSPVARRLRNMNKNIEVVGFPLSTSMSLRKESCKFVSIPDSVLFFREKDKNVGEELVTK